VRFVVILIMFWSMMCMCDYLCENAFVWMEACREENEVEKTPMFLYLGRKKICNALFDAKN
jgi:hypothetical protein